jgi:hypothetical protein
MFRVGVGWCVVRGEVEWVCCCVFVGAEVVGKCGLLKIDW